MSTRLTIYISQEPLGKQVEVTLREPRAEDSGGVQFQLKRKGEVIAVAVGPNQTVILSEVPA